ncbi:ABC transporter substrate-binding protein [Sphingomonas naphthae]|uniref:ABC transporter substrate-binding protein n=1 Tax=Sphingomonas naphthae TaxID=1813468 RepID=A0ABY7TK32_9SPHN|nr:ABC transporter substrate-binding protein [Sphingomonas naphthae]WCT73582.1 ABC transporter substrate-binding protein [Sphingomonas naphthae]
MKISRSLIAATLGLAGLVSPIALAPASAAVDASDPSRFITTLTTDGLGALRSGNRAAAKAQFRTLLAQYFAVDAIGDRLIRRWSPTITPAQKSAYKAAFPNYIIGTYADRLFEYANAQVKVVRATPAAGGTVDVTTQVIKPGQQPIVAVWSVAKAGAGYKVTNLKVAGINLAIAQAADFDAIVQRQGFDALVAMMKSRSAS